MSDFTDRELKLLINSTHERAMRLLDLGGAMAQKTFRSQSGKKPTTKQVQDILDGHKEHLNLVEKLRSLRSDNAQRGALNEQ